MDPDRRAVAAELLTASREHDAAQEDRVARYRNLEPESAELLGVLVRAAAPKTVLERAGLTADLRTQDAGELLRGADDGGWEFVFLDVERPAYAGYWPDLLRTLAPGALLVIDNVISHAEQVEEVTAPIEAEPTVTTALVPIGAGLRVVVKA